jgi:hypothetical protein
LDESLLSLEAVVLGHQRQVIGEPSEAEDLALEHELARRPDAATEAEAALCELGGAEVFDDQASELARGMQLGSPLFCAEVLKVAV